MTLYYIDSVFKPRQQEINDFYSGSLNNTKNRYKEHIWLISDKYISKTPIEELKTTEELTTKSSSFVDAIVKRFRDLRPIHRNNVQTMIDPDRTPMQSDYTDVDNGSDRTPTQSNYLNLHNNVGLFNIQNRAASLSSLSLDSNVSHLKTIDELNKTTEELEKYVDDVSKYDDDSFNSRKKESIFSKSIKRLILKDKTKDK